MKVEKLQQPEDFMDGIYDLQLELVIDRLNRLLGTVAVSKSEKEKGITRESFTHDAIINYFFVVKQYLQPVLTDWHKKWLPDRYFYETKTLSEFAEIAIYISDIINIKVFEMVHVEGTSLNENEFARFHEIEKRVVIIGESMKLIVNIGEEN